MIGGLSSPLRNVYDLVLQIVIGLLQLPHPTQVAGQTIVQALHGLLVIGGGRGIVVAISPGVGAQSSPETPQSGHRSPGVSSPGPTEHTCGASMRHCNLSA